jgi:hypothetical protein
MTATRRNIASVSAGMWNLERSGAPLQSDRCEYCGASLRPVRLSIVEIVANAVCRILMLTVLSLAGYLADELLERNGHELFDHPVWHEPLDCWSF